MLRKAVDGMSEETHWHGRKKGNQGLHAIAGNRYMNRGCSRESWSYRI